LETEAVQKLVLQTPILSQLGHFDRQLELCDADGNTVGYFVPAVGHDSEVYEWAKTQISDEELSRRKNEPDGRSTTEILERLARQ
jgi:hypothetical protein